ncbi:MAG: aspartate kinase [Myxococcales bacterium]|nr:aspartate kinase [Myxococcales bacterium]
MKFGGSSVADVARIHTVADRIVATAQAGRRVVAVVSAMGKTTDQLMRLAHEVTAEPDRRELDMLLTAGERIAMALVAMAVRARGLPATSLTGSQCGILTNDSPGGARIVEVRPFRVQDALDAGHVVIVAGFQGVSWRREVTTLGRGGSDTTAVALAAALDAEACEIYSDVAGIYTGDPKIVVDARQLAALTHDEVLELARAGAKVLAADAVAYARMHGIALYARATLGTGETVVRKNLPLARPWCVGVATRPHALLLHVDTAAVATVEAELTAVHVAPLVAIDSGDGSATLLFARDPADSVDPAFDRACAAALARAGTAVRKATTGTLVSVVGPAVGREPGLLAAFRAEAARVGALPAGHVIAHGMTLSALVDPACAGALASALHTRFVVDSVLVQGQAA